MDRERVDRLLNLLGLARRAGRLAVGFSAVERLVKRGERPLIVVARDIGAAQREKVRRWQPVAGCVEDIVTSAELADRLGRQKLAVVGVSDPGFVKGIAELID